MSYIRYIGLRILQAIPTLIGLSILIFTITRVLPGDPVRLALQSTSGAATEEAVERVRRQMGLDEPTPIQYIDWLVGLANGDWGTSLRTQNNVLHDILARFPATMELVLVSLALAIILAIPLGVYSGTNKDRWPDHISRIISLGGVSMPRWWVAIVFQVVFVGILGWFPLTGRLSNGVSPPPSITHFYLVDSLLTGQWHIFVDAAQHILLPALALSVSTLAQVTRLIRSEMIEQMNTDYVLAERAYGLPNNLIEFKYMFKNAFSSSLTIIGLAVGGTLGNAFLVEYVFGWPGFGRYGANAILFQDFNAIVGVVMVVGIIFVFANLTVDLLYGYLDPRIRFREDKA